MKKLRDLRDPSTPRLPVGGVAAVKVEESNVDYADSVKLLAIAAVDDILEAYVPNYRNMGKACPDCRAWLVDWVHRTCTPLLAGLSKGLTCRML